MEVIVVGMEEFVFDVCKKAIVVLFNLGSIFW